MMAPGLIFTFCPVSTPLGVEISGNCRVVLLITDIDTSTDNALANRVDTIDVLTALEKHSGAGQSIPENVSGSCSGLFELGCDPYQGPI